MTEALDFSKFDKFAWFNQFDYVSDPKPGRKSVPYDPLGKWNPEDANSAQADFHKARDAGKRFLALFGGSGLGKSMSAAREAETIIIQPNTTTWLVGPNYGLAEKEFRYVWEDLVVNLRLPVKRKTYDKRNGNMSIEFAVNNRVECKSFEVEESLLGEGLDCLVLCEGAKLKRDIYDRYLERAVARRKGIVICNTTPSGMNWVYDSFYLPAINGHPDYWTGIYDVLHNPFYDRGEYERLKAKLPPQIFQEQVEGMFVRYSGLIFSTFDRRRHLKKDMRIDPEWPMWALIDLNHARGHCVLYLVTSPWNQRLFVDEIWHHCSLEDLSYLMREKAKVLGRHPNHIIYDGPEIDNSSDGSHIRRMMSEAGIRGKKPRKTPKGAQFITMDALFKQEVQTDHGPEALMLIDPVKCEHFVWELEHLEWHQNKSERSDRMIPKEKGDDAIDCWRYAEADGIHFDFVDMDRLTPAGTGGVDFRRGAYRGRMVSA